VLLIACVNTGNPLLARGSLRQREFAMRRALGATRSRLLRQLLTESLVLAIGGGIGGLILARWSNDLLERSLPALPSLFPRQLDLSLDWRAIAFATVISLVTTVLCGLLAAWRASQASDLVTFKGEIRGGARRRRPVGLIAQVVMSLALLFVAGSFLEALLRLQATDPGFAVTGRLYAYTFTPTPPFAPETAREFYSQVLERLRAVPGVRSATLTDSLPLMPAGSNCASLSSGPRTPITTAAVGIGYFQTMAIGIAAGRDFDASDLSRGSSTVVVTESLARRLWPGRSAIGERVMIGCDAAQAAVVIGVVRDSAIRALDEPGQPHLYRPFGRQYAGGLTAILVETRSAPAAMVQTVRDTLLGLGRGIRVYTVEPLSAHVEQSYAEVGWRAAILTGFGLLALLLAAIGLSGVIAYRVSLRTQEIGVRMAVGANRAAIFREVLWQGLAIVLVGIAFGEALTFGLTRVASSLQTGIRPTDLSTHAAIWLIWIAVALVACYLPAARAARVDPLVALRCE
jgi:putative ABC transport system permease protein